MVESGEPGPVKVVLDANVVLAGIASSTGDASALVDAVIGLDLEGLNSRPIDLEYVEASVDPKWQAYLRRLGFDQQEFMYVLADFRLALTMHTPEGTMPMCDDEKDRIYLHCAQWVPADYLVTYDRAVHRAAPAADVRAVYPNALVDLMTLSSLIG